MVEGLKEFIARHNIEQRDGKLVFYKAVSKEWGSLWVRMLNNAEEGIGLGVMPGAANAYRPGTEVLASEWDSDRARTCGKGLHICDKEYAEAFLDNCYFYKFDRKRRLIEVLVDPKDVVCVPRVSDSKIRCKRLIVVKEIKRTKENDNGQ